MLPELAATAVHVCTGVGPVVIGVGQVVVTQLLPDVPADAVQLATGTFVVLFVEQVVVVQLLPDVAAEAVHVCTGTFVVVFVEHSLDT